jgi:septal ring-binding cell division protein DamX
MRLKLYCNRFGHFKDALVCSVNCAYRTRCKDFALFYGEHRDGVDALVSDYYEARREPQPAAPQKPSRSLPVVPATVRKVARAVDVRELIRLEVKREMAEAAYLWIDRDGRAELLEQEEIIKRASRGLKPQTIYRVAQEMELRFQLVPRKHIERARAAANVEQERAAARRAARRAPAKTPTPATEEPAAPPPAAAAPARRARRRRAVKALGERA